MPRRVAAMISLTSLLCKHRVWMLQVMVLRDSFNVNKLGILDEFEKIKVGVKYVVNEEELSSFPGTKNKQKVC